MPAGLALKKPSGSAVVDHTVGLAPTAGPAEPLRPPRLHQRRFALCLGAVLSDELGHGLSRLKLDPILGHGVPLHWRCKASLRPVVTHRVSLQSIRANQEVAI